MVAGTVVLVDGNDLFMGLSMRNDAVLRDDHEQSGFRARLGMTPCQMLLMTAG
jgi:hypothetical protein